MVNIIMANLKVSIVTAVYNSEATIEKAIDSVRFQSYQFKEHIIVDGKSSDNTLDIIKSRIWDGLKYISEEDSGIYNAINKGLSMCSGDLIIILNSDDYLEDDILNVIVDAFSEDIDFTYGSVVFIDNDGCRKISPLKNIDLSTLQCMPFPHISLCVRRNVVEDLKGYSEVYAIAGDFDFIYRMIASDYRGLDLERIIGYALGGGVSSDFKASLESYDVVIKNGKPRFFASVKLAEYWIKYQIRKYAPRRLTDFFLKLLGSRYAPK